MTKKLLLIIAGILSLSLISCTQKSFEVAPGDPQPTSTPPHQPHAVPTNSHPLFVDEFNFNTKSNNKSANDTPSKTLQPDSQSNQNNN